MKLIAGINDVGNNYQVVSVYEGDETEIFEFGGTRMYEIPSIECFNLIKESLVAQKAVYIPKNLSNHLTIQELIIQEAPDSLDAAKLGTLLEARQFVSTRIGGLSMFYFFAYANANNYLASKGFFITDENREEKYLEIVNMGDDALSDILEKYLESYDKLKEQETIFAQFMAFKVKVEALTSAADIKNELNEFYASFG